MIVIGGCAHWSPALPTFVKLHHFKGRDILPEFLSLRFLNTEMITSRFPSTSTTVVKINTLARIPMTQAGRALPSVASVRSSCPSRGSVRFFMSVNVSGITGPQPRRCFQVPTVLYVPQVPPAPVCPKWNMERTWVPPRAPQERTSSLLLKGDMSYLILCGDHVWLI